MSSQETPPPPQSKSERSTPGEYLRTARESLYQHTQLLHEKQLAKTSSQGTSRSQRQKSKKSDPSEHLRTATKTSDPRFLEVPSFNDLEMERYCKSLRQDFDFECALENHTEDLNTYVAGLPDIQVKGASETSVKPSPYENPWTHNIHGKWIDGDEHQQGVEVSLHSNDGIKTFKTEFTYERPPTEILEEYMRFDPGTKLSTERSQISWEEANAMIVSDLRERCIEEPFTSTSSIKGQVKFMSEKHTSLGDPISVQIIFLKDRGRDPLRYKFQDTVLSKLE
jgi:hypothetical protein